MGIGDPSAGMGRGGGRVVGLVQIMADARFTLNRLAVTDRRELW
jgi:hypothetical protein